MLGQNSVSTSMKGDVSDTVNSNKQAFHKFYKRAIDAHRRSLQII